MTSGSKKKTGEFAPPNPTETEVRAPLDVIGASEDEAEPLLIDRELSLLEFNRRVKPI